jgi:hypothetical protein
LAIDLFGATDFGEPLRSFFDNVMGPVLLFLFSSSVTQNLRLLLLILSAIAAAQPIPSDM